VRDRRLTDDPWLSRFHRIEQFGAGQEHHAGAQQRQHDPQITRINFEVMAAALDGAHRQCVDHQPNLGAGLDGEQPGESHVHRHRLRKLGANRAVPPVPD
jgi:hypothetical protein